jgi:2-desacetyl-2-hydroxyethyl bacteriochlorophyllide A dehydrogenase
MIKRLMRAARLYAPQQPLRIEEAPMPEPGPGEVLVQIVAAGICGTDLHFAVEGALPVATLPLTLGHEAAGRVAVVGPGVRGWKEGDRVCCYPQCSCGLCRYCLAGREPLCLNAKTFGMTIDGAFAEYLVCPERALIKLPDSIPFEIGAIVTDAVASPFHALRTRGGLRAGETVAVFGCGGLGYHAVKLAHLMGASQIIAVDVSDGALEHARRAGADHTVNAAREDAVKTIRALTEGVGVDLALEFVGRPETVNQSVKVLGRGGRAVVVGVGPEPPQLPPLISFVGKENALIASFGMDRRDTEDVLALVAADRLDLLDSVTARLPLSQINEGLRRLKEKEGDPIRIVIEPGREP